MNTHKQQGAMLLEALIAILIFSMGILALVGMQAAAITNVSEAKYRTDAAFLANQITGEMWVGDRADLATKFVYNSATKGTSPALIPWASSVSTAMPGVTENPPTIAVAGDAANGFVATITVRWKGPQAVNASRYVETVRIRNP